MENANVDNKLSFLQGGGEMGERIRNYDWKNTVVKSPEEWPQSLRTAISIMLNSKFPMFIWWGDDLIQFYNDAYRPSLGNKGKHPAALGQKGVECWPEIWSTIKPLIDGVFSGEEATWSENQLIPIYRNGSIEDVYWTFSYSPIKGESGAVEGVLVVCDETTEKVTTLQKLKESEQELRFTIESTGLGIWDYNPVTKTLKGNARLAEWWGLKQQEEIEFTYALDSIIESDRPRVEAAIEEALQFSSGGIYNIEYTIRNQIDHVQRFVKAQGRAWFDEHQNPYRFNGIIQDITKQTLARKKIEENEQQLRSIMEAASIPIGVYTGEEMCIRLANKAIIEAWGKGDDVMGKLFLDVLPELRDQYIFNQLTDVFNTGIPCYVRNREIKLIMNGIPKTFYFNYNFIPLRDTEGNIYGVLNTASDVTDLNLAHKKIEESEKNLRNTILQAPVAMCILAGPQHIVEIANQRMFDLWGKDASVLKGKPLFDELTEAAAQGFEELVNQVYRTGESYQDFGVPISLPRSSGIETVYVDLVYEPFREQSGIVTGVIAVATDVTSQVIATKKTIEAEERARIAIESAELGTYEINLFTNEMNSSQRFNAIWGLSEPVSRFEYAERIHPDDRLIRAEAHELSKLTGNLNYEVRIIWDDESIHWVKISGRLIYNNNNQPETLLGVAQDITIQKEIEHKKDGFIATVSHELRTPLTSMNIYSQLLLEKHQNSEDKETVEMLSKMNYQVNRLNFIIQDLLDVTRMEANKIVFRNDFFYLDELTREIVSEVQIIKTSHRILIGHMEKAKVYADKERTSQVLTNLLTNAIRYSPKADRVIVAISVEDGNVICSVTDFGNGIPKDKQAKIFERFYQVTDADNRHSGFGLGLYISAEIIERQHGKIWVKSEPGKGSKFYFSLRLHTGE
ncbi:MAG: ATP-binding protein [Ginsengibacter sp.]